MDEVVPITAIVTPTDISDKVTWSVDADNEQYAQKQAYRALELFDPLALALAEHLQPHPLYRAHDDIDDIGNAQADDKGRKERIQLADVLKQHLVVIHRPYQDDREGYYEKYSFYGFFADIQSTLPFFTER